MIRPVRIEDAETIIQIYNHYVQETAISFETDPVTLKDMEQRIRAVTENYPWIVYEKDDEVIGYAYASKWKTRDAYKHTLEVSIYVDIDQKGMGLGSQLMKRLILDLPKNEIHSLVAGIAQPNEASVALHEKFGFQKVAHFFEVGYKFGRWHDVGYWQLKLK